jgi:hypothetical protein
MSFQNPGAEKYQEGLSREVIIFSGPRQGREMAPRNSWTLFIFEPLLPDVWYSVFFKPLKIKSSLYTPS